MLQPALSAHHTLRPNQPWSPTLLKRSTGERDGCHEIGEIGGLVATGAHHAFACAIPSWSGLPAAAGFRKGKAERLVVGAVLNYYKCS